MFALLILSALGLASLRWGVDTRDGLDWHSGNSLR